MADRKHMPFAPRVAIVTGAASGIGFALARELITRGATVVVADLDADATARAVANLGPSASAHVLDVADATAVAALVDSVAAEHGRLDAMVNNAGILLNGPFDEYDTSHWRRAIDVNLMGVVNGSSAAYRVMTEQGSGTILNTGSLAGLMVAPRQLPYTVTKQAVVALSRGLAQEAGRRGVGVHVVCPAFVDTKLLDETYAASEHAGSFRRYARSLQPRLLSPRQVAVAAIEGIEKGRTVIPVGALAHALWRAERLVPRVVDWGSARTGAGLDKKTGKRT